MATRKVWKRIVAVVLATLLTLTAMPASQVMDTHAATATKLYLKPNSNWKSSGAWFAAYFFGNGDKWVKMTDTDGDGYYECDVPAGYPSVIFCRMSSSSSALDWSAKWNQTADLTVPTNGTNCYTVAEGAWDNGSGSWSTKIFGYYVAGSSGLCGENWNTTADPMTANSNGTYSITFSNVAAGTHTFKVVANGDYSAGSWPSSDYSLTVPTASDVTITFTPSSGNISVSQTPLACTHSYTSEVTTAATCTTAGVRTYTCSKCGDSYTEAIEATGHTMVNGTCSVCGHTVTVTYTVTYTLTNLSYTGSASANSGSNFTTTLLPADGYHLPASITVRRGNTVLTGGTHYSYNSATGAIIINSSAITGDITIAAAAEEDYYILVGTSNLTGSSWDTTDTDNLMTPNADGTYSITYQNVASGNYEVKAVKNGSYDSGQWPYSGNKAFTVDGTSTVTVTLNLTTHELTVDIVPVVNTYNVTFNGTNVTSNGASTATDASNYTATLTPAAGYHLPASITVAVGGKTVTSGYSYNSSTGALTINKATITGDITVTAAAEADYYILAGTQSLTGSNWDITDTDNLMTQNADGTYSITYTNVAAGDYEVKAVKNGSYDSGQWPYSGNKTFKVDETSNVTVTLNLTTNELTVDVVSQVSHYDVAFNGTNVTSNGSGAADDEHDYTATLTAAAGYKLPSAITVQVGGSTLNSRYYTYNSTTGALTIPASRITDDITITAVGEDSVFMVVGTEELTGSNWGTGDPANRMTKNDDGTYTIVYPQVPAGSHEFKITENGAWKWPADNYVLNLDTTSKVTITYDPTTGEGEVNVESVYVRTDEVDLSADSVYYVNVDLVDYLNNNRVQNNQVKGYYTDNQGEWLQEEDAVFSYMNNLVSEQVYNGNQYTYPLYFGPLHYVKSRYSKVVGSGNWLSLGSWSTAANVAFGIAGEEEEINSSAVAQGLVKNTLDANGNLVDPATNASLLYFNEEAAETWTNNGHKVMAYYPDLQFPFVKKYDAKSRVTTYSYDSASDYAVYYDYTNPQLYASNTHVQDYKGNSGFYPLNAPTDKDNMVNNGFGAKFTIDFTVGEDGYIINRDEDGNVITKKPVTFEFTGDDDVWVFIDGVLVLDMGGAHAKANGKIDFADRVATVSNAAAVSDSYKIITGTTYQQSTYTGQNLENYIYDGYNDGIDVMERATPETAVQTVRFEDLGLDFDYGSVHTMTVFYMERGMFESNFSMEFTMVPVPSGLTLSKNLNDAAINKGVLNAISRADDLSFTLKATSPDATSVAFSKYTLTDKYIGHGAVTDAEGSTSGSTYTATINGINNYVYAHSFVTDNGEDAFIPGTQFVITETTKGIFSYSGTTWAIYDANNGYQNITSAVKNDYDPSDDETADDETTDDDIIKCTAAFTMGAAGDTTAYSYAVSFTNTMNLGALQVVKNVSDEALNGVDFTFDVYIDLDGSDPNFSSSMYPGLVYTVGGTSYTSVDGTITVPGGQTAVISGLPANATYRVEEDVTSGVNWNLSSSSGTTGTITTNGTQTASFTNAINEITEHKTIYVQAGTATDYTIKYNGEIVDITSLTPVTGLTATDNGDHIQVNGSDPDQQYTLTYEGRLEDGTIVRGTVTVYTFRAVDKLYVFDFGLSSNLADTTYDDGLFQQDYLFNQYASGETVTLYAITGVDNTQTAIDYQSNAGIQADGTSAAVTFRPTAFMSKVESYTYTIRITAHGKTFDANNPETGCAVTGTVKVMPANSVYYENNFNVSGSGAAEKFIYSANAPTTAPTVSQSNDQSSNYGHDDAYLGDYADSNDSSTLLGSMEYTYFTFTGTGFDLDSRTTASTAGMAVYVFMDTHKQEYLEYVTDLGYAGTLPSQPADMVFVNNYYANGDLYQVPVVSVRLDAYATYTVYIQCLPTSYADSVVIDGVRIYNPLADTSEYPLVNEQKTVIEELRVMYKDERVSHAIKNGNTVAGGIGKGSIVEQITGGNYTTAQELMDIYLTGPNNEMYLPANCGIRFSYTVTGANWTIQLGAKAVTASDAPKTVSVWVRSGSARYTRVDTIQLTTTTDMYYDLTATLADYCETGVSYDVILISEASEDVNNEFVSLTTLKHAGVTLR